MISKEELTKEVVGDIHENENLAKHTWYRIGGRCKYFIYPRGFEDIQQIIKLCRVNSVDYFVIGDGANLLVHDNGFEGIVISLQKYFNTIKIEGNDLEVGAGSKISDIIKSCENSGLSGFEQLSGIPGTVGGLLRMNAGTDTGVISDCLRSVTVIDCEGNLKRYTKEEIDFGYRSAPQLMGKIIIKASFKLFKTSTEKLREIRCQLINKRFKKQPLQYPSCGSVFKRPTGDYAGRLIESAGMKGFRIGDAEVSTKHAGFIINLGKATAYDVFSLMVAIRNKIKKQFNINLDPEVKLIGYSNDELKLLKD